MGRVENIAQFNDIIIKNAGGVPIRLRDVGYAEDGMAERRTFAYYQNQPAVLVDVTPSDRHQYGEGGGSDPGQGEGAATSNCRRALNFR